MSIPIELKDKIKRIANLPTLPQVACHLMDHINNPDTSSSDVASIARQDMSLSAKILRLSNSAFYGIPRTIANINDAIVILGFKVIYTMVLSLTVFDMFPANKLSSQFNLKAFWKHSLICGVLSKIIAEKLLKKKIGPEDAFCAGLLHDIGKIVMEQYLHDDLHKAIDYSAKSGKSFFQSETDLLGYTHSNVTEWLVSRWNLPDVLYYPLIYHHYPEKILYNSSPQNIKSFAIHTCVCHIADYVCYDEKITGTTKSTLAPPHLDPKSLNTIGITDKHLESVKELLPEELEKMAIFYDLFSW